MTESFSIDHKGWLQQALRVESSNFGQRPEPAEITLIVVHAISLPPGEYGGGYVQALFTNQLNPLQHSYFKSIAELKVSAHCLIERDGSVTQFVSFLERAWHAGVSSWKNRENCNDFSIGIELEGCDADIFTDIQYRRLAALVKALRKQYPAITENALCGHSDIAPGRKTDPGPLFDWKRLRSLLTEN